MAKAAALFEQAIALDPGYALAHSGLADAWSLAVDYAHARAADLLPKAKAHALKALELDDALAEGHASLGSLGMMDYQWDVAERELKRAIEQRFAAEPVPRGGIAAAHLALGDKDGAFTWLERAVEERDQSIWGLKVSARWASLRSVPRYHELVRRMNLE